MKAEDFDRLFEEACRNDAGVHRASLSGMSPKQVIGMMYHQSRERLAQLMELEQVAPKAIKLADGYRIWRAPDEFVIKYRTIDNASSEPLVVSSGSLSKPKTEIEL